MSIISLDAQVEAGWAGNAEFYRSIAPLEDRPSTVHYTMRVAIPSWMKPPASDLVRAADENRSQPATSPTANQRTNPSGLIRHWRRPTLALSPRYRSNSKGK